ncbi:sensory neuron membrane protein 1-like [Euwallacea similis]|uniref:sensory neuron membrane protein 1-like n=1 Tax=Euwallacea similis TaxID=1736056 RepID=UPI00344BAD07
MRFAAKLVVGSVCAFVLIILVGFLMFPNVIKAKIKGMVNLKPDQEIREMFLKVPFPLNFKVYIFSVENPEEIHRGSVPELKEIGPFCYQEWKTKINVNDIEGDDTMSYNPVDTFISFFESGCVDFDTEVTVPHPMILGMVNTVVRQKPGALTLIGKAINSIWSNPTTIFTTVKAKDLLFDGVVIHCGVKDFAGSAICAQLRQEESLTKLNENDLAFSFMGSKNATPGKKIRAYRGVGDFHNVGKIVTYDGKYRLEVWNDSRCDAIKGTDGTIFPPMLKKEDGLVSFAPDLCRALVAKYQKRTKYDGIPVSQYSATLGDPLRNPEEKCFCTTPQTCLKKGLIDLYKCVQVPIYASQPHFYDTDQSYLKGVKGLAPETEKHAIKILFEPLTGSPVSARKRLQFNMPLEPVAKLELFRNFTPTVLPLFWVEEGIDLNNTYTKPLKSLFLMKKIVSVMKYLILVASMAGFGIGAYLFFNSEEATVQVTSVHKVQPEENGNKSPISTVFDNGQVNGVGNNKGNAERY